MEQLIGRSDAIRRAGEDIDYASRSDVTVLVTGERGVGKKLVARFIHGQSRHRRARVVPVHCQGVSDTQLATELFGQNLNPSGRPLPSRLQQANGGTLLLNGVNELSLPLQDALLHFLASREFPLLGPTPTPSRVDVRLIATSHDTLFEDVTSGRFRDDLFYRLNTTHVTLPPLRRRREDISVLLHHFMRMLSVGRELTPPHLTDEAEAALRVYDWPGNVTQLRHVATRLVAESAGEMIDQTALPREILGVSPRVERERHAMKVPRDS